MSVKLSWKTHLEGFFFVFPLFKVRKMQTCQKLSKWSLGLFWPPILDCCTMGLIADDSSNGHHQAFNEIEKIWKTPVCIRYRLKVWLSISVRILGEFMTIPHSNFQGTWPQNPLNMKTDDWKTLLSRHVIWLLYRFQNLVFFKARELQDLCPFLKTKRGSDEILLKKLWTQQSWPENRSLSKTQNTFTRHTSQSVHIWQDRTTYVHIPKIWGREQTINSRSTNIWLGVLQDNVYVPIHADTP